MYEHRKVWQDANGPIPPGHVVHHRNGDGLDNRLENLEIQPQGYHIARHRLGTKQSQATINKRKMSLAHYQTTRFEALGVTPLAPSEWTTDALAEELNARLRCL